MSEDIFEVKNELEKQLLDAINGDLSSDEFMTQLFTAQVFMPVKDEANEIKGFQRSTSASPMVIQDEDGSNVLVLFTSPDRAKPFVKDFPAFGGGLLADFKWVLERMDTCMAIAVNPGWEVGMDLDPNTVGQMMQRLASVKAN
ncbi:SseB family protein [Sulfurirhabdus autotrophica]|uniref:Type III secretion system (T3SS) SseB-like protein n=1 Tax=Sulfurirhabdus autotrophica TaxID=1706046 RepID=A0A4R3YB80_9PROT|nr:SseB family protein [Sulfurirhabdus autotrophica]TCV88981.1 type III secretion system (T3SS) SseB-like protein [Sulfurirhabdus autotrophica]